MISLINISTGQFEFIEILYILMTIKTYGYAISITNTSF